MKNRLIFLTLLFTIFLASCGSSSPRPPLTFKVSPDKVTLFGNERIQVSVKNFPLSEGIRAYICGHPLYDVRVTESGFTGNVPGCPEEGWQNLIIENGEEKIVLKRAVKFFSPYPLFRSFTSIGASYTAGFINLGLDKEDQLFSPFAQVARQAGAYFPQPLIKDGFFTAITLKDLRENGCRPPDLAKSYVVNLLKSVSKLKKDGNFPLSQARIDPYLKVFNLGIGAARISDSIYGAAKSNNALIGIFEHLTYDPFVDIWESFSDPPEGSPFEVALRRNTEYILTVDLFADDILYWHFAQLFNIPLSPGITTPETFKKILNKFFKIASDHGKKIFIADLPDITQLPAIEVLGTYLKEIGFSEESINSLYNGLREDVRKYNSIFYSLVSSYPNVYAVPFSSTVEMYAKGVTIDGKIYTFSYLGGLISLDGIHPTRTGYALIANMFIERINQILGLQIPLIDIDSIAKTDPMNLSRIRGKINIARCREEFYEGE